MEGLAVLLILLVVCGLLCGPIALIVALVALGKSNRLTEQLRTQQRPAAMEKKPSAPQPVSVSKQPPAEAKPSPIPAAVPRPSPAVQQPPAETKPAAAAPVVPKPQPKEPPKEPQKLTWPEEYVHLQPKTLPVSTPKESLEQRIGTRWILIAGIIVVLLGVTFFLKYAYEQNWMRPWLRAVIIAAGGIIALTVGEITRRRDYEIVAKGTTALGFALLYFAVFSAYKLYSVINPIPAFALAVCITIAAMAYAVALDEVLIAFLSLLGGYLTPLAYFNGPVPAGPLFTYLLILSLGAMACGYFRRWRAVNVVAFIGTFLVYVFWFEKFCRGSMAEAAWVQLKPAALSWLGVFFAIYLVMPLLYGWVRQVNAHKEDVVLVLMNGIVTVSYLCMMLYQHNRSELAIWCAGLGAAYLAAMAVGLRRCREDSNLHITLLALGIIFCTAAVPLYFGLHASLFIWALEGVFLAFIGIRYQSLWTRAASILVLAFAVLRLWIQAFPLHTEQFRPFLNASFFIWIVTAAAILVAYLLWRLLKGIPQEEKRVLTDFLFNAGILLAAAACAFEWHDHCTFNLETAGQPVFLKGMLVLVTVLILLYRIKPIPPEGEFTRFAAASIVLLAGIFSVVALVVMHDSVFRLFINASFGFALLPAAATLATGWIMKQQIDTDEPKPVQDLRVFTHLFLLVVLGVLLSAEVLLYWQCKHLYAGPIRHWNVYAALSLAVLWALYGMVLSFAGVWAGSRKVGILAICFLIFAAAALLYRPLVFDTESFRLFINPLFGAWIGTAACWIAVHGFWRWIKRKDLVERAAMVDFFYAGGVLLAAAGFGLEWYRYYATPFPEPAAMTTFYERIMVLAVVLLFLFSFKPLCPDGFFCRAIRFFLPIAAALYVVLVQKVLYYQAFRIFANSQFAFSILLAAGIFLSAWLIKLRTPEGSAFENTLSALFGLMAIVVLWILLSSQIYLYWYCRHRYAGPLSNWAFYVSMYLSILWAIYGAVLMILGFWRKLRVLRYTALALFALLLGKIFVYDMSTLKIEYRIAAYLASGLVLVAVSYLYQFAKKKGFFEAFQ